MKDFKLKSSWCRFCEKIGSVLTQVTHVQWPIPYGNVSISQRFTLTEFVNWDQPFCEYDDGWRLVFHIFFWLITKSYPKC